MNQKLNRSGSKYYLLEVAVMQSAGSLLFTAFNRRLIFFATVVIGDFSDTVLASPNFWTAVKRIEIGVGNGVVKE